MDKDKYLEFLYSKIEIAKAQAMHVCPLQLDIVQRIITRYSSVGDVVYDPFAGLFTVPYQAVKMGRYGIGTELNPEYFKDGIGYMKSIEEKELAPTLFDVAGYEATS